MSLKQIKNYLNLNERVSSSGQPSLEEFSHIADAGYEVVINLALTDSPNTIANEKEIVTKLGMKYIHIPVPFDAPQKTHLEQFFVAMKTHTTKKCWIHCVMNWRVSAFMYHYEKVINNKTEEQAQNVILPTWEPDEIWQKFLSLYIHDSNSL